MSTLETAMRNTELFGQGIVRGLASGTASLGDLAVNAGYNWTTRNAINLFKEDNLGKYESNFAGKAADAVSWTEARDMGEESTMLIGQSAGEFGAFVGTMIAGGVVWGPGVIFASPTMPVSVAAITTSPGTAMNQALVQGKRVQGACENGANTSSENTAMVDDLRDDLEGSVTPGFFQKSMLENLATCNLEDGDITADGISINKDFGNARDKVAPAVEADIMPMVMAYQALDMNTGYEYKHA
jgi:hypothetical protein